MTAGGETISLATAFGVVLTRASYLVPLAIVTLVAIVVIAKTIREYRKLNLTATTTALIIFAALFAFAVTLLYAPCEIAANTTVELFQRTGNVINP